MRVSRIIFNTPLWLLLWSVCSLVGCAGPRGNLAVPEPEKAVDLSRYVGRWYEFARYENGFERGCERVTADYQLQDDGRIQVLNTCERKQTGGKDSEVWKRNTRKGEAKVVSSSRGAKLKVSFFPPFAGDYWVLDRGDAYEWAIVGEPSGRYLWLLTRASSPSTELRQELVERTQQLGYDLDMLHYTEQSASEQAAAADDG